MARRDSAPRRYADAAFEIALRDGTVDTWRMELEAAAATSTAGELESVLANPAIPSFGAAGSSNCHASPSNSGGSTTNAMD